MIKITINQFHYNLERNKKYHIFLIWTSKYIFYTHGHLCNFKLTYAELGIC